MPAREVDDGAHALHLEDDGLPVLVGLGVGLLDERREHLGMAGDPLKAYPERGGSGLVAAASSVNSSSLMSLRDIAEPSS